MNTWKCYYFTFLVYYKQFVLFLIKMEASHIPKHLLSLGSRFFYFVMFSKNTISTFTFFPHLYCQKERFTSSLIDIFHAAFLEFVQLIASQNTNWVCVKCVQCTYNIFHGSDLRIPNINFQYTSSCLCTEQLFWMFLCSWMLVMKLFEFPVVLWVSRELMGIKHLRKEYSKNSWSFLIHEA